MIAFIIAGLIIGALAWQLRHDEDTPGLVAQLLFGVVGGVVGGVGADVVHGEDPMHVDAFSFTAAVIVALIVLGCVQGGVGRRGRS